MFDDIICMNRYGETIRSLVQWDLNQTLFIYDTDFPIAPKFQYSNSNSSEALTVQSEYVSGVLQCVVPNQLMVEPYPITCYLYIPESEKGGTVVGMFKIPVRPRPKPSEFEYEDNVDIINIEKLRDITIEAKNAAEMAANDAESSANASASSASASATSAGNAAQSATNAASSASAASQSVTDAAYQVELAEAQVAVATQQATSANNSALVSEGHAVGTQNGVPVSSSSPYYHNNSKYWAEQAAAVASQTLGGLTDVALDNVSNGQVLTYDSDHGEWTNEDPVLPPSSLADLTDVDDNLNPSNGYLLRYNTQVGKWCAEVIELGDLSNVSIAGVPMDGAALVYSSLQGKWIPGNVQSDPYYAGTTAPTNTHIFWVDTANGGIMKRYNGSAWVTIPSVWT